MIETENERQYYIYAWKMYENEVMVPFYIGKGKYKNGILEKTRCRRAYEKHNRVSNSKRRVLAFCQLKANKLAREGTPHIVEILYHNLTNEEADEIEISLIKKYGRLFNDTGILYNLAIGGPNCLKDPDVRKIHATAMSEMDKTTQSKMMKERMNDPIYLAKVSKETKERMNDPEYKKEWLAIFRSPDNIEHLREVHSTLTGIKLEHKGVMYRSKKELARFLGISSQLLSYRLKNDIPLDAIPNKGNEFFKRKGNKKSEYCGKSFKRCPTCGEEKDNSCFSPLRTASTGFRSSCKECINLKHITKSKK